MRSAAATSALHATAIRVQPAFARSPLRLARSGFRLAPAEEVSHPVLRGYGDDRRLLPPVRPDVEGEAPAVAETPRFSRSPPAHPVGLPFAPERHLASNSGWLRFCVLLSLQSSHSSTALQVRTSIEATDTVAAALASAPGNG